MPGLSQIIAGHFGARGSAHRRIALGFVLVSSFVLVGKLVGAGKEMPVGKHRAHLVLMVFIDAYRKGIGIDSCTIVALMQARARRPVKALYHRFDNPAHNEAEDAKAVARHLGTEHTELYVTGQQAGARSEHQHQQAVGVTKDGDALLIVDRSEPSYIRLRAQFLFDGRRICRKHRLLIRLVRGRHRRRYGPRRESCSAVLSSEEYDVRRLKCRGSICLNGIEEISHDGPV